MSLVVDASVAFKWFVPEVDDDKALALLNEDQALWAPDLVLTEVANGLWVRLRSLINGQEVAAAATKRLPRMFDTLPPSRDYLTHASQIAFQLGHPIYDCVYLAMCEQHDMVMITADERLRTRMVGTHYEHRVRSL